MSSYKDESTRDIICLDFDFGSRSYEEELKHVEDLIKEDPGNERLQEVLCNVKQNKDKYIKKSKDEIRELFYKEGVTVRYDVRSRKGNILETTYIHYKMLYRNSSKAKLGQAMFIKSELWELAINWLTMDLYHKMPDRNAKIVELAAYAPLTTSTISDVIHIPVDDILFLEDQDSFFKTIANIVTAEDYETSDGEISKRCVVSRKETEVKNTLWDGMGLIESNIIPESIEANGMVLLRNHMFKACAFKTKIQLFFKDWCEKSGYDYSTYQVVDMFGNSHYLKDIKLITTDNAIKWKKFKDMMGGTLPLAYKYWRSRIINDGCVWGIVKTDHPSKLGEVQQMSYQMINTLPCTFEEVKDIAQTSINYVETLKQDNDEFEKFLRKNANEINHYEMLADLYAHNHVFADSKYFRSEKRTIINNYVFRLRGGKITVNGDNLTMCGNPYALLLYSVGEDWKQDPTLLKEPGVIQCYTTRFNDGVLLCGFRSPHNSPNNCVYLHNIHSPEMDKYFDFSKNIIAVNCIGTDVQSRLNGADFDSDFIFATDHPALVKCAKKCYKEYPTIVNALNESGLTYDNTMEEYARMDNKFSKSRRGIGESSNLAQLAMTYYWTYKANRIGESFESLQLYDNFVILSVLAQLIIDSCKREYEVDSIAEIERIKKLPCMNPTDMYGNKKDFPQFMKYTRPIPTTKNGKDISFDVVIESKKKLNNRINENLVCPMDWLQMWLNKIQGASKTNTIPTQDFFKKIPGKISRKQIGKVINLAEKYDTYVKRNYNKFKDEDGTREFIEKTEEFYEAIAKVKITNPATVNRLVELSLSLNTTGEYVNNFIHYNAEKFSRKILNGLYRTNKELFLNCFF